VSEHGPLILCIEDEPDLREDLLLELSEAGLRAMTVADGSAGLAAIEAHRPNLVICDIQLPSFSGLDLLRKVHERFAAADRPSFVILSAFSDAQARSEAAAFGATNFLVKPVDYAQLITLLEQILPVPGRPA
jgi:CheY-like chemotaxis protein